MRVKINGGKTLLIIWFPDVYVFSDWWDVFVSYFDDFSYEILEE